MTSLEFKIIRNSIVAKLGVTIIKNVLAMGSWAYSVENYASKIDLEKHFNSVKLMVGGKQHHCPLDQPLLLFFQHYPPSTHFTQ